MGTRTGKRNSRVAARKTKRAVVKNEAKKSSASVSEKAGGRTMKFKTAGSGIAGRVISSSSAPSFGKTHIKRREIARLPSKKPTDGQKKSGEADTLAAEEGGENNVGEDGETKITIEELMDERAALRKEQAKERMVFKNHIASLRQRKVNLTKGANAKKERQSMAKYIKDLILEHETKQETDLKEVQNAIQEAEGDQRGYVIRTQTETLEDAARGMGNNSYIPRPRVGGWGPIDGDKAAEEDEWQDTDESSPDELKEMFANLTAE